MALGSIHENQSTHIFEFVFFFRESSGIVYVHTWVDSVRSHPSEQSRALHFPITWVESF